MMRSWTLSMVFALAFGSILLPLGLGAQESQQESQATVGGTVAVAESPEKGLGISGHELAENIQGRQVVNALDDEVGEISGIIISGDRVTHAIISIGGFVGIGGSDVVVPFGVLRFEDEQVTIETLASSDQIEELTLFEPKDFGLSN